MDRGWRRLPEVDDPRLIFTDVVHQHYAATEKQYTEKALTLWIYPSEHKNLPDVPFDHLTLRYQKYEDERFPSREQQRWRHPH